MSPPRPAQGSQLVTRRATMSPAPEATGPRHQRLDRLNKVLGAMSCRSSKRTSIELQSVRYAISVGEGRADIKSGSDLRSG